MITAVFGVGGLIAALSVGYISDKIQNRFYPQLFAAFLYIVAGAIFYSTTRFYQVILFRFVLGMASSIADTILFTVVADVYPANLLGLKMAVLFVFDNVGNMLGPVVGGEAYQAMGVDGIAVIVMCLGMAELVMISVFVRNSLEIRHLVSPAEDTTMPTVYVNSSTSSVADGKPLGMEANDVEGSQETSAVASTLNGQNDKGNADTPETGDLTMWKLVRKTPVIGPTIAIFVATGLQSVIETVFPLRLNDKFGYSPEKIGVAFLIVDGILILAMPLVGFLNDHVIARRGERMRYYTIAMGAMCVLVSLIVIAVAPTYAVLITGYSLFAITAMVVIVPSQSAFGDFINSTQSPAMAQCYSLAAVAEGVANISLPPISTALYSACGFLTMLISMGTTLCVVCAAAVLAFPARHYWMRVRSQI
ncbi:hypothetical protein EC988_004080 [Linderina pennispora]|nr:hypothetical protein EC988_004080 [Linderina pennispora]